MKRLTVLISIIIGLLILFSGFVMQHFNLTSTSYTFRFLSPYVSRHSIDGNNLKFIGFFVVILGVVIFCFLPSKTFLSHSDYKKAKTLESFFRSIKKNRNK